MFFTRSEKIFILFQIFSLAHFSHFYSQTGHVLVTENVLDCTNLLTLPEQSCISQNKHPRITKSVRQIYDKYLSLCQLIFQFPTAIITSTDLEDHWSKSELMYENAMQILQNDECCSYINLPDSPYLVVLPDTSNDARFSVKSSTLGNTRFFAGAALIGNFLDTFHQSRCLIFLKIVGGHRIGSLCVVDKKPFQNFGVEKCAILLHLASTLSSLLELELDADINRLKAAKHEQSRLLCNDITEKKRLMIDLMHQVRTPLMGIQLNSCLIESEHEAIGKYLRNDVRGTILSSSLATTIVDLKTAISQLDSFVTSTLQLEEILFNDDQLHLKSDIYCGELLDSQPLIQPVQCNLTDIMDSMKMLLLPVSGAIDIEWTSDPRLSRGSFLSYPDVCVLAIESIVNYAVGSWGNASVFLGFSPNVVVGTALLAVASPKSEFQLLSPGYLNLMIRVSSPISELIESNNYNSSPLSLCSLDMQIIERMVYDVGGDCRKIAFDSSSSSTTTSCFESNLVTQEQLFELHLPCNLYPESSTNEHKRCQAQQHIDIDVALRLHLDATKCFIDNNCLLPTDLINSLYINEVVPLKASDKFIEVLDKSLEEVIDEYVSVVDVDEDEEEGAAEVGKHRNSDVTVVRDGDDDPLRILVVDDSPIIYKVLTRWLETQGCEVTCAVNGKIALSFLQTQRFDITLMDFIMPVMLGRDAMKYFQEWKADSPVNNINNNMLLVGMSANASLRDQEEAFLYGMHFFASKPVDLTFLSSVLSAKSKHEGRLASVIRHICIDTGYSSPPTQLYPSPLSRIRVTRRAAGGAGGKEESLDFPLPLPLAIPLHRESYGRPVKSGGDNGWVKNPSEVAQNETGSGSGSGSNGDNSWKSPQKAAPVKSTSNFFSGTRNFYNLLFSNHTHFDRISPSIDITANISNRFTTRAYPKFS